MPSCDVHKTASLVNRSTYFLFLFTGHKNDENAKVAGSRTKTWLQTGTICVRRKRGSTGSDVTEYVAQKLITQNLIGQSLAPHMRIMSRNPAIF